MSNLPAFKKNKGQAPSWNRKGPVQRAGEIRHPAGRPSSSRASSVTNRHDKPMACPKFSELVQRALPMLSTGGTPRAQVSPLAVLDYAIELQAKQKALAEFWRQHRIPGRPDRVAASPKPRHYRTTTKRRCFIKDNRLVLGFEEDGERTGFVDAPSLIEPAEHAAIYEFLLTELRASFFAPIAKHLNYMVVRGTYEVFVLILNLDEFDAEIVRKLKILCGRLQRSKLPVLSAFAFLDPKRSRFYLDSGSADPRAPLKKFFGPDFYTLSVCGLKYSVHPLSFSQVNESMVPLFLGNARTLLAPATRGRLLDLYCGYGLFSLFLAPDFEEVIGLDSSPFSIRSAIHNREHGPTRTRIRFLQERVSEGMLEKGILPGPNREERIILDPPRHGTDNGVIGALARRGPARVVHIFCSVDEIPAETLRWKKAGYWIDQIVPLDMFPGTPNLEVLVGLSPRM